MPVSIHAAALVHESDAYGSIDRATLAVRRVLEQSGTPADGVDLLVNTGGYRDDNLMEPAISALIQKNAEINLSYTGQPAPALSFDLINGPCGFLDAVEIAAAVFATGQAGTCVIVSGDGHPARETPADFPYQPAASAVLLTPSTDGSGFGRLYRTRGSAPHRPVGYIPMSAMGPRGRSVVTVDRIGESARRAGRDIAINAVRRCLTHEGLHSADVVLLAAEPFPGFAESVATALGIASCFVPDLPGNPHTAALPFAYRAWLDQDPARTARHILFLGADGYSVAGCTPYRIP